MTAVKAIAFTAVLLAGVLAFYAIKGSKYASGAAAISDLKISVHSAADMVEKDEYQVGELPLYLYLEYKNGSEDFVDIIVRESYNELTIETDYTLIGTGGDTMKLWLQTAKNIYVPEGTHSIKVFAKNGDDSDGGLLGETALRVTAPRKTIAKENQVFSELSDMYGAFIASAGITDSVTAEFVPAGDAGYLNTDSDYYIYFTVGNVLTRINELCLRYKIYSGGEVVYTSKLEKLSDFQNLEGSNYLSGAVPFTLSKYGNLIKPGDGLLTAELILSGSGDDGKPVHSVRTSVYLSE